jgi:hypothetical protein
VTETNEKGAGVSQHDRGLLFVSYQSDITNGFRFVQKGIVIVGEYEPFWTNLNPLVMSLW